MNIIRLVWNYLKAKPLNTVLNIFLLALGITVITVLLLFNHQLQEKIENNARGIDLVVGAKGSPLQLILCSIFHIDFPTGNINLAEAERLSRHRLVKKAVPMALGDSYQGFRIVGTTHAYSEWYNMELAEGAWWSAIGEATIGANVARRLGLAAGSSFVSTHGLASGGEAHDEEKFVVKGIMKQAGNVMDNLILVSVPTIWEVHAPHEEEGHEEHADTAAADSTIALSPLVPGWPAGDSTREITTMLIQYRSPMGAIQMPRYVNGQSNMQAASPAFETARLFSIMGVGVDILMGFAYVLIGISALSIFIALYNSLKERRYDMAIMRSMGATRGKLVQLILCEGALLTLLGTAAGLLLGHGILVLMAQLLDEARDAGITGIIFYAEEWIILAGSLLLGAVCALVPAVQAYRTDISNVLAGN